MNTRLVIILVVERRPDIRKTTLSQNVDAILIIEGNHVMLWQPGMDLTNVSHASSCVTVSDMTLNWKIENIQEVCRKIWY